MTSFSAKNRSALLEQLRSAHFDVLVIGGGITGAGIALDATVRGLKVALIEMQDFAGGTSGRSTKLIHGGLRYLKQLEFKLVAEVGKEREIIHRIAPHLTKPEHMLLPIVKGGSLGKITSQLGMFIYEKLAGVKKEEYHKWLSMEQTLAKEPLLKKDGLLGGILFYEYRTDDARLTIEVLKEALERGATALNYIKANGFIYEGKKIVGVRVSDELSENSFEIKADQVVNAAGPWVEEIDELDKKENEFKLRITKGVHVVVDRQKLPVNQALYFDTYDKRMLFVIPREGKTYIGTTDTFYKGNKLKPEAEKEDVDYILKCANAYFPDHQLVSADIEACWAGLRPLINKPGKSPSEISRKDEMFVFPSGLITIAGGKLTGYRKMAQRVVDVIAKNSLKRMPSCTTDQIHLSGGEIQGDFYSFLKEKIKDGIDSGLSENEAKQLVTRYGSNCGKLFSLVNQLRKEKSNLPLVTRAQLQYTIENELCISPADFFIRRTGQLYFDIAKVNSEKEEVFRYMKQLCAWTDKMETRFSSDLESAINEMKIRP